MQNSSINSLLKTMKNVKLAFRKLKGNTFMGSQRHITDEKIEIVNDYSFFRANTVQSKDEMALSVAQSKASRFYYRWKIYITNSFLFHKICIKFLFL